jgi:prepilin-type N-terminal cleavage/methylation domain-containing protein
MKTNAGFTLIEVLVAMVVTMIIMAGAYSAFLSQQKSTVVQTNVSDIQQNLRAAMDFLARDIRMAGYAGPTNEGTDDFGFVDVRFSDFSGNPNSGSKDQGFLQFTWDTDGNTSLDDSTDRITYSLSDSSDVAPGSIALMREVGSAGRQPMAGYIIALGLAYAYDYKQDGELDRDAAGNVIWAVDTRNDGVWDNLDTDGDGQITPADTAGGTSTGTPVRNQDIRAVRIWLLGRSEAPDNNFIDNKTYVVGPRSYQPNNHYRHRLLERTVLCRNMGFKL